MKGVWSVLLPQEREVVCKSFQSLWNMPQLLWEISLVHIYLCD